MKLVTPCQVLMYSSITTQVNKPSARGICPLERAGQMIVEGEIRRDKLSN